MQNVDLIGVNAVKNVIEQSNLPLFTIWREGDSMNATPVFESLNSKNASEAGKIFERWANNVLQANPATQVAYQIAVFKEQSEDARARANKIKFSFVLNNNPTAGIGVLNAPDRLEGYVSKTEMQAAIAEATERALMKVENDNLKARLAAIEEAFEEEEEEEEAPNADFLSQAAAILAGVFGNKNAAPVAESLASPEDRKEMLNRAVRRLYACDKNLPEHLDKLADVAENNKPLFTMILQQLEAM